MGAMVHVTAWEKVSLWRRIPVAFLRVALLIVLLNIVFDLLGPPIEFFVSARWIEHKAPEVDVTPRPLADYSVSEPTATLSENGYEFKVPWTLSKRVQKVANGPVVLAFQSGQALVLFTPANKGLLTEIAQDKSMHMDNTVPLVMGDLMNHSPYEQYKAIFTTTPSSIRAFGPRRDAVRGLMLLTFKAIAPGSGLGSGVFSFDLPDKHGFEVGDPAKSKRLQLQIFGRDDYYVEFNCGAPEKGPNLTQSELNLIITSLHRAPKSPAALQTSVSPDLRK
jgi:hypothetical protein